MTLPWFRLYAEMVDDAKVRTLAFEDRWHYVAVLCCKAQGILDEAKGAKLEQLVGVKLGLAPRDLAEAKRRLLEADLIGKDWQPFGWERRQYKSDTSRERTRKWREKSSPTPPPEEEEIHTDTDTESDVTGDVTVTLHESLPISEWNEWLTVRKRRRWPCDPTTLRKQLKLLSAHDRETQREILDTSMQAGWQGLFPPKGSKPRKTRFEENQERLKASMKEVEKPKNPLLEGFKL